jgi:hypothetical protein
MRTENKLFLYWTMALILSAIIQITTQFNLGIICAIFFNAIFIADILNLYLNRKK